MLQPCHLFDPPQAYIHMCNTEPGELIDEHGRFEFHQQSLLTLQYINFCNIHQELEPKTSFLKGLQCLPPFYRMTFAMR